MERASGILMPVFSLPSPHGIGTLGREAHAFVDFLADAGQSWWQMLPLGPTAFGNSPYQSPSVYAGNPFLIDLDLLAEDGLLAEEEIGSVCWGDDPEQIDYGILLTHRLPLLEKAADRCLARDGEKVAAFTAENAGWLDDYALFMAVRQRFGDCSWQDWPDEEIRLRRPEAMERYRNGLAEQIRRICCIQYLFFRQWEDLREHAREKNVRILGDMPLYVAPDSADVWASPESFLLDEKNMPVEVAGVPPDYFCEDGQLWGNPLYDYEEMRRTGYGWWIRRIDGAGKLYDAVRIDHFRGLASFWAVKAGEKTAKNGRWVNGPGMDLLQVLQGWFPNIRFIAEDLGIITDDVRQLLADSGLPGMKVLEFAFSAKEQSSYLPHLYDRNCVCYAGTHDNNTLAGWLAEEPEENAAKAKAYLGLNEEEGPVWGVLRGGMSSVADLFIAQMQDYLELGAKARTNTPGTVGGNWRWRMLPGAATAELAERIRKMAALYDRCAPKREEQA